MKIKLLIIALLVCGFSQAHSKLINPIIFASDISLIPHKNVQTVNLDITVLVRTGFSARKIYNADEWSTMANFSNSTSVSSVNWPSPLTRFGGIVPNSIVDAIIANSHVVTMENISQSTRNLCTTANVDVGGTLAKNLVYNNNETTKINGTFQIKEGGFSDGANDFGCGTASTLNMNHTNTLEYGINTRERFWPIVNPLINVNINSSSSTKLNKLIASTNSGIYFRSAVPIGDWANPSSWESSIDNATWSPSSISPDNTAASIIILDTHKIQISSFGVSMTNITIQNGGILEITTDSSFDLSGDDAIELTVEDGGIFLVNSPGNFLAPTGTARALVKTGGKLVAGANLGSGAAFSNAYLGRLNGLFYFGNEAICEWLCSAKVLEPNSAADNDFFSPYEMGDLPIFRISAIAVTPFGSTLNNVFYAVLEANANFYFTGSGDKTFIGGIIGSAAVTQNATSGKLVLGDGINVPTIGGSVTLNVLTSGLQLPNGAKVPLGASPIIMSSFESNSINRQGGDLIVNGTLDITNMRITNTSAGGIVVNGTLKTSNTGGLYGGGAAILGNTLTLNQNSTIEYYATADQLISSAPTYFNIIFSGAGIKTTQGPIKVDTNGLVKITGTTTVDATSNLASTSANNTAFTMDGGRLILRNGGTQPKMRGTYSLTGGVLEFADASAKTIRSPNFYQNIEVTGNNVGNGSGNISLNDNGTFIVKTGGIFTINSNAINGPVGTQTVTLESGAIFKTGDKDGFSGSSYTSIQPSIENIILKNGSTVEYSRETGTGEQVITLLTPYYPNLKISGIGIKTLQNPLLTYVDENLNIIAGKLLLKINEAITVNKAVNIAGGTFEIENNGQLIQIDDNAINTGIISYERIATVKKYDYVYWSSPVANFDMSGIASSVQYGWDATAINDNGGEGNWVGVSGDMAAGTGYIFRVPNSTSTTSDNFTATFLGTPLNGIKNITVYRGNDYTTNGTLGTPRTASDDNWNLIGNPYPSAIDLYEFLDANSAIEGFIYVWKHGSSPGNYANPFYQNYTYNYNPDDYTQINKTGTTSDPTDYKIGAGQGFFVLMSPGSAGLATVSFKNSLRSKDFANNQFYKSTNKNSAHERNRIWLDLNSKTSSTRILLGYLDGATNDKDRTYDAFTENKGDQNFYSVLSDELFKIQGRALPFNQNDTVALGVNIITTGMHSIAIAHADGIFVNDQNIYLEDKLLNIIHDLRKSPYQFSSEKGIFNERFMLQYTNASLEVSPFETVENIIVIASKNEAIKISSSHENIQEVDIYDILGRKILNQNKVNNKELTIKNMILSKQTYIVRIKLKNGKVVSKKIVF